MNLGNSPLERKKAVALVILSNELLSAVGSAGEALLSRSLRQAVAQAVDAELVTLLVSGAATVTASELPLATLRGALSAVSLTGQSRPYWLAAPSTAVSLATAGTLSVGSPPAPADTMLFPTASPVGASTLLGLPLLVSGAIPSGSLVMLDASAFAAAADGIEVEFSTQAAMEMSDAPSQHLAAGSPPEPTAASMVSMFTTNSTAVKALAFYAAQQVRANSVAVVQDVAW